MTAFAELDLVARTEQLEAAVREIRKIGDAGERTEQRVSRSSAIMSQGFARLARMAAAVAAPLLTGALFSSSINEARTFETTMLRVQAVIDATGGVAGRSADQLREQARQLALGTLESTEGVLRAQQTLLTFRNVQGDVFDRAIVAAADMSSALGGDLNSATMQLARALENPTEGISALTRSGTVFTQSQKDIVAAMVEAGDMAGAQGFILAELEAQYGGTAMAAAQGFAGAQDTAAQRTQELKLALAEQLGLLSLATSATSAYANGVLYVTEALPSIIDGLQVLGVVIVGLAATQIPALVVALAAKTAGMTAASIAAGVLTGAMRVLGVAVAIAGGPWGILAGLVVAAVSAFVLFRQESGEAEGQINAVAAAQAVLNAAMGTFYTSAAPDAADAALRAANAYREQAAGARDAAAAELALAEAELARFQQQNQHPEQRGLFVGDDEERSFANDVLAANVGLDRARAALIEAELAAARTARAITGAMSEGMTTAADAVRTLTVTVDGLNAGLIDIPAGAGGAGAAMNQLETDINDVATAADNWASGMAGHFDGLITGGRGFSGVLMSIARQLESSAWQGLFSGISGGGGGGFGGLLRSVFAGFFDGGGMIPAGQFGVVGERGPEIVRGPASVTSRADTARMMQGRQQQQPVEVVVRLQPSGEFDARVERTSGAVVSVEGPGMVSGEISRGGLDGAMAGRFEGSRVKGVRR